MTNDPRIVLVFPPIAGLLQPYLSLPALAAFLRKHGCKHVFQKDINAELFDLLLSENELKAASSRAFGQFKSAKEEDKYSDLAEALFYAPSAIKNIREAKDFLKSKEHFYDQKKYKWASGTVQKALKLILREHYSYERRVNVPSIRTIRDFIENEGANPLFDALKEKTVPSILKHNPDFVGISVSYHTQITQAFTLAKLIKQKNKNIHICMGGGIISYLSSCLPKNSYFFSYVDTFIINEGEYALLELIKRIGNKQGFAGIPNLIYYGGNNKIDNEDTFIRDIDSLPTPDFDGLNMGLYLSPEPVLPLLTSRGCYWGKCAFCSVPKSTDRHYRPRKIQLAIDDIAKLSKKFKARHFFFTDNAISPKRLQDISNQLIKRKLSIEWQTLARFEKEFDTGLCRLLAKTGCRKLSFGLESVCPRVLKLMEKGTDFKTIKSVLKNIGDQRICADFQFFTGFPTESEKEARRTINFALSRYGKNTSVSFNGPFQLFESTKIFASPDKYGITKIHKKNKDNILLNHKYDAVGGMDTSVRDDLVFSVRKKICNLDDRFQFIMYPSPNFNAHTLLYASYNYNKKDGR